jgi:IclR family transcriptional regulator, KDG regulon repressor
MLTATKSYDDRLSSAYSEIPADFGALGRRPPPTRSAVNDGDPAGDGPLERALALVEAFSAVNDTVGVSELARRCGMPKSTAHRILGLLERSRLVRRVPAGYRLGCRLYDLVNSLHRCQHKLRECLLPYLVDIYEATHATVHLWVLEDDAAICLERRRDHRP